METLDALRPTDVIGQDDTRRGAAPAVACASCGRVRTAAGWVEPTPFEAGFMAYTLCPDCRQGRHAGRPPRAAGGPFRDVFSAPPAVRRRW